MEKQDALAALAALGHETRLDAFRLLVRAAPDGLSAGALADALDVPSATLSFHLKELKSAGVVTCRREGRSLIYGPNFDATTALIRFLTRNCCEGVAAPRASSRRRRSS